MVGLRGHHDSLSSIFLVLDLPISVDAGERRRSSPCLKMRAAERRAGNLVGVAIPLYYCGVTACIRSERCDLWCEGYKGGCKYGAQSYAVAVVSWTQNISTCMTRVSMLLSCLRFEEPEQGTLHIARVARSLQVAAAGRRRSVSPRLQSHAVD